MSDDFEYDQTHGDNDQSGSGLRKQLETALQKARDAEARAAKAESNIAQRNLADSLGERGYDKTVAKKITRFMSKDDVDLSDEAAVNAWLEDNGDIFSVPSRSGGEQEQQVEDEPDEDVQSRPDVQAFNRLSAIQSNANPAERGAFEQAMSALSEDASKEEVYAALAKAGI